MSEMTAEYMVRQKGIFEKAEKTEENICNNLMTAVEDVQKQGRQLCEIINDQKENLTRQLKAYQSMALTTVRSIQKEVTNNQTDAQNFKDDIDNLRKHGSDMDQIKRTPGKRKDFNELIERKGQSVSWKFNFENKDLSEEALRKMFGEVRLTPSLETTRETVPGRIKLGRHLQSVPLVYGGDKVVSGMVVLGDCLCVTHSEEPSLWLYDMAHGHHKVCDVPGLQMAEGMAVVNPDERTLVITDENTGGGMLHFLKLQLANLEITDHKVKKISLKQPKRISTSRESGQLLIGEDTKMEFAVCNVQGDVLKQIQIPDTDGSGCDAWCVTATRSTYAVLVWDTDFNGRIQWLDDEGYCIDTYGHSEGEKMEKAFHMIDIPGTSGSLIVVDHINDRLHLVNRDHRLAQYLLTVEDTIARPDCIYLDEITSRLYVAFSSHSGREVNVYMWPPQSGDTEVTNYDVHIKLG